MESAGLRFRRLRPRRQAAHRANRSGCVRVLPKVMPPTAGILVLLRSTRCRKGTAARRVSYDRGAEGNGGMIYRGPAVEIPDTALVPFVLHRAHDLSTRPA